MDQSSPPGQPKTRYPSPVFEEGASATSHSMATQKRLMEEPQNTEKTENIMVAAMVEAGIPTTTSSSAPAHPGVRPSF